MSDDTSPNEKSEFSDDPSQKGDAKRKDAVAVAMSYSPDTDHAPRVIAGGRGTIAEQILEIAFASGIKVRKDADLAELLSAIEIDDEIPTEAFAAVAEILIYVYKVNGNWPDYLDKAFGGPAPHGGKSPETEHPDMGDKKEGKSHE